MTSFKNFISTAFLLILTALFPQILLAGTTDKAALQADFSKTALPILQQSCFACHGPKPQSTDNIQDPDLKKKADKMIAKAQKEFAMAETFPFPQSDEPKDDLKDIAKSLQKGWMPPKSQKKLNLGQPLSAQDKKALLDWVARAQKALN
jgi:cytochrome c553